MTATSVPVGRASAPSRFAGVRRTFGRLFRMPTAIVGAGILLLTAALAILSPLFISDADLDVAQATGPQLGPPSGEYWLGTDQAGRSVAELVIWGARASLVVGITATVLSLVVGTLVGLLAGHYGGVAGRGLMMVTDWFIALPALPLAIAVSTGIAQNQTLSEFFGDGEVPITIAIALTSWTGTARLVRAQTLAVEAQPFIERAKVLGAGNVQIMVRHVLPNVTPLILVSGTLTVASAILAETTLTFLGVGDPTEVSWGGMLNQGFNQGAVTAGAWWYLLPPGIAILIVVLGFTMLGRAAEVVLNPRARS